MKKPLRPYVGVGALASPLEVGADRAAAAAGELADRLEKAGCSTERLGVLSTPDGAVRAGRKLTEAHVDAVAFAPASWFEDYLVTDLLEECRVPVFLWPLPGMETGALCGAQQLTAFLKQLEQPYACAFGELSDQGCLDRAMTFLRASALKGKLRRARIGIAGQRIGGMTHTSPNEFMLKKVLGPRLIPLDLPLLLDKTRQASDSEASALWKKTAARAGTVQVGDAEGRESMKLYLALRDTIGEQKLDAVTVGCYPHLMGKVCLAASLLADEGIPFACEGDVNGAVGQLMLMLATGAPTHHTDWLDPLEDGTVIFTHCGSGSFSLAETGSEITLGHVRLMNGGVCALFTSKPGPVTLVNLVPFCTGYQCALLQGEALPTEMVFPGNPVRVRFPQPTAGIIDWIFEAGVVHHWMVGYGHVGDQIRALAGIVGRDLRLLEPAE